jgi:hypothetical protein
MSPPSSTDKSKFNKNQFAAGRKQSSTKRYIPEAEIFMATTVRILIPLNSLRGFPNANCGGHYF